MHRWSGLVTGPLFVVLGISGAVLVFRPALENTPTAATAVTTRAAAAPSLDAILRSARLSDPRGRARAVRVPARPDGPYRVELYDGPQRIDVAVDPATLRVVGSRAPERSALAAVHALHGAFHAGRAGALVVAMLGLWLIAHSLAGLWLYGASVTPRRGGGVARSRTLHRLVGTAALAVTVIVGLTGALLGLASALAPGGAASPRSRSGEGLTRLDDVAARARAASPGSHIVAVVEEADGLVRVDVRAASGREASVVVDRRTEQVVAVREARATAWEVVRRLHAGDFAGSLSRTVYALVGLALPLLSITGYVIAVRRVE